MRKSSFFFLRAHVARRFLSLASCGDFDFGLPERDAKIKKKELLGKEGIDREEERKK